RRVLFPCVTTLYQEPIVVSDAEGVWVRDTDGAEYLDFFAGILTTSVGHCNPDVVSAVRKQIGRLGHTSTLYITENQLQVAEQLGRISPGELSSCYFTNSGSEAVETAIMLAQQYTGQHEVIALRHSYSGRTALAATLTAQSAWRPKAGGIAHVRHAMVPYPYRTPGNLSEEALADLFAHDLEEVIRTTTNGKPAAFFAETIQGVGGVVVPPAGYFQRAAAIIRKYGGLFICDEVQPGFGRTGDHWFAIEHWDVEPDIMVMAKGMANGFPVGATITRPEIAEAWQAKTISTFGGNPVSMAAAHATMTVMEREHVPARAAARGAQLKAGLFKLYDKHAWIGEVRGKGLMQGIELVKDRDSKVPAPDRVKALLEATKKEGLLVGVGGMHGQTIRIGPSLLITEAEMNEALTRLANACDRV
ncbi:MAG: aspartate aminotransferase family protein, partial [Bacteroidota bacterium]